MKQQEGSVKMCNVQFNSFKVPTLKDELINIQNDPEQYFLSKAIDLMKEFSANGREYCYIYQYTENIKKYLEDQGISVYEEIYDNGNRKKLHVNWR